MIGFPKVSHTRSTAGLYQCDVKCLSFLLRFQSRISRIILALFLFLLGSIFSFGCLFVKKIISSHVGSGEPREEIVSRRGEGSEVPDTTEKSGENRKVLRNFRSLVTMVSV